jgi:hypothetical protein
LQDFSNFGGSITDPVGTNPYGSLVKVPGGRLYGPTTTSGYNAGGSFFYYDPTTNEFDFLAAPIDRFNHAFGNPVLCLQEKCFGLQEVDLVIKQVKLSVLMIFPLLKEHLWTTPHNFTLDGAAYIDAFFPLGSLYLASYNLMYEMTTGGGVNFEGVIFSFNPNADVDNNFVKLKNFSGHDGSAPVYSQFIELRTDIPDSTVTPVLFKEFAALRKTSSNVALNWIMASEQTIKASMFREI